MKPFRPWLQISRNVNDPDINPKDIAKLIVTDQGLTSFILKRVNSPYYRLAQKVDNIFSAIVILGYNEIYRIVMEERTSRIGIKPSKEEWVHANLTSTVAAYIASTSRKGCRGAPWSPWACSTISPRPHVALASPAERVFPWTRGRAKAGK